MQTMVPERRRELQDERVRELVRRVFERPVLLFRRKLESAGITSANDVTGVDDLSRVPGFPVRQARRCREAAPRC